ncbi:hypothetical protein DQ04_04721000 [Trypanosoma grayi]|uniref:hypothetical protein n=1 Tax=Trypanosoma grayi TaxID=71804 RepID=UPI0004F48D17|nr:hypothetical protein DQ04_04721000 [Trypanosoma grayi]KEG09739.1 hypothetical protein DQ04_04721000 [Trypanosoma grayi]
MFCGGGLCAPHGVPAIAARRLQVRAGRAPPASGKCAKNLSASNVGPLNGLSVGGCASGFLAVALSKSASSGVQNGDWRRLPSGTAAFVASRVPDVMCFSMVSMRFMPRFSLQCELVSARNFDQFAFFHVSKVL